MIGVIASFYFVIREKHKGLEDTGTKIYLGFRNECPNHTMNKKDMHF